MARALIVEPDEGVRSLQRMILRQHAGAEETVERKTLDEALPLYASEPFDFAMIDISRPSNSLEDFLHISKKEQKSPVIAFTAGHISRATLETLVKDHVFAVFPKPFELEEVVQEVRAAVEAARTGNLHPKLFGFLQRHQEKD